MSTGTDAILGYGLGEIDAQAGFTSNFWIDAPVTLQDVVNLQETERRIMDQRPGMQIKCVPSNYDTVTGQLQVGGYYLFDTWQDVLDYDRWTTHEYEVGPLKEKFWSRSIFKDVKRWNWKVIGAFNFDLPDQHAISRFQRWTYTGEDAHSSLRQLYPAIKDSAKNDGVKAVWVFHQPEEKMVGILRLTAKDEREHTATTARSLEDSLEHLDSLDDLLKTHLSVQRVFDRTSLLLAQWLPISRRAGGVPQCTPNFPVLPGVTVPPQQHESSQVKESISGNTM